MLFGMDIPISPEQRAALNSHPGAALPIIDYESSEKYFLVPAPAFLHLQGLAVENDRRCHEQLRQLVEEGINSPEVSAEQAFSRLRSKAEQLGRGAT
jgi:hypothetical protein